MTLVSWKRRVGDGRVRKQKPQARWLGGRIAFIITPACYLLSIVLSEWSIVFSEPSTVLSEQSILLVEQNILLGE